MAKSITSFQGIIVIVLNIFASILVIGSQMILVYKYGWSQESQIAGIINADAVLTIIVFSVLSLISATLAFFLKRKYKSIAFLVYLVLFILNVYQLLIMMPIYSG